MSVTDPEEPTIGNKSMRWCQQAIAYLGDTIRGFEHNPGTLSEWPTARNGLM